MLSENFENLIVEIRQTPCHHLPGSQEILSGRLIYSVCVANSYSKGDRSHTRGRSL